MNTEETTGPRGTTGAPPGSARHPGESMQDILDRDGDAVPAALREQSFRFTDDADIPFERFTSPAFFDAELEHMWRHVWQWACRVEHVPSPGDWYVYDIGPWSIVVVRGEDGALRAFANSCPHRGMQLCEAGTRGAGKQFIRCPFHGMSWHLDGSLREIPCDWDFPHVSEGNFRLVEVPCEVWNGFVFVNLDRDAGPLADYLGVLPEHFRSWDLSARRVALHTEKLLPINWKLAIEGFLEAYHILATHPEGLRTAADANAQYDVFDRHVSRFIHAIGVPSPHLPERPSEARTFAALGRDPDALPEGATARAEHARLLRREQSERLGVDLSGLSTSEMLDSIEYYLFPNACFFPGVGIPLIYRFRPVDPDHTIHEILWLEPVVDPDDLPAPPEPIRLGIDDSYTQVPGFPLALVLDQDTENFKRQRAGVKASLKGAQTLGNYQECRIRHLHETLDSYLGGGW